MIVSMFRGSCNDSNLIVNIIQKANKMMINLSNLTQRPSNQLSLVRY